MGNVFGSPASPLPSDTAGPGYEMDQLLDAFEAGHDPHTGAAIKWQESEVGRLHTAAAVHSRISPGERGSPPLSPPCPVLEEETATPRTVERMQVIPGEGILYLHSTACAGNPKLPL